MALNPWNSVWLLALLALGCGSSTQPSADTMMPQVPRTVITSSPFGDTPDGPAQLFGFENTNGVRAEITNYGGIIVALYTPDRQGSLDNITLGFDSLETYVRGNPFFGALVGRYGNRIGGATFDIDGTTYTLAGNNNGNHIHGGVRGFDKFLWQAEVIDHNGHDALKLHRVSPDMEEGYPGNLDVTVIYSLDHTDRLAIEYIATSDKKTIVNLTNHAYYNLAGQGKGDILDHEILIRAEHFTPVDAALITTGEIAPVEGTPFDFRSARRIGDRIDDDHPQIGMGGGYDHNFVLAKDPGADDLQLAAEVYEPTTGRVMQVHTTEPGVQFYTGNFMRGIAGRGGATYPRRSGFCLETQHYPDSPNKPDFPSVVLSPGETYRTTTAMTFSAR